MKIETYEKFWSDLVSKEPIIGQFYPRRIAYPHGYLNPSYYSMSMFGAAYSWRMRQEVNSQTNNAIACIANQVLRYNMPVFFVDPQFLMACDKTNAPPGLTFESTHWPLPALMLAYPVEYMRARFGWPFAFAGCCRTGAGGIESHPLIRWAIGADPNIGTDGPMCLFHFPLYLADGNPVDYASRYPVTHRIDQLTIERCKFEDFSEEERLVYNRIKSGLGDHITYREVPAPSPDREAKLLNELTLLTAKVVLAMSAVKSAVTTGGLARPERRHNGVVTKEALWHPNYVGHGYQLRTTTSAGGDGTHASPRMHWRVGHWHHVVHGKGRALRKLEWFEPVLVNPPK